uniref:C2 domain-containing protein n=1 Tax=Trichogramma kaykai TaxID=54128 RepID=A0ABD2XGZ3_9HYME
MTLAGPDHLLAETTAFLGACLGFVVLLMVVGLYLTRKWYYTTTPVTTSATTLFGGVCVPLCEANGVVPAIQNIGNGYAFGDLETSSDSEEDALRRLGCRNPLPPDTLTIQAEDGLANFQGLLDENFNATHCDLFFPFIKLSKYLCCTDAATLSCNNNCLEERESEQQQQLQQQQQQQPQRHHLQHHNQQQLHHQQQCIVDVGSSAVTLDHADDISPTPSDENVPTSPTDTIASLAMSTDEVATLEVAFLYDAPMREMTIHVLQGRNYPAGIGGSQVRLVLLPSKKQRRKTRVRQGSSPQYMESFLLPRVNPEDVNAMGVRVRVYLWSGRMRRERLLGEARVSFDRMNLRLETTLWLALQPPPTSSAQDWGTTASLTRSDSTGSQQSVQSYALPQTPPYGSSMKGGSTSELLLGLTYNGVTGRLSVEIIKGSHFRTTDTKPPDTYVKLALVDANGHEMGRAKTGLRRAQPNPLYKETFIFQVALFQLAEVTLYLSVYNRRRTPLGKKGREMIGWLCLGQSCSGADELQHWNDVRAVAHPTQIQRWHSLLRP